MPISLWLQTGGRPGRFSDRGGMDDMEKAKNTWAYWLGAALIFLTVLFLGFCYAGREERLSPEVVIFGDSIFGQNRGEGSIAQRLQEQSGMKVLNGAFGGTCMARQNRAHAMDFGKKDDLSMVSLVRAVVSGDFSQQQSIRSEEPSTEYYEELVDELDRVDFDAVKIVILAFGINDYHSALSLDDPEDPLSETTYAGALRTVLLQLRSRYPGLRIILMTPTYSWYLGRGETCEEFDPGGGVLERYVEKETEVAREYGVEILDLYHGVYPHETWEDSEKYTVDGVHPNTAGIEKIAAAIEEYLTMKVPDSV